MKIRSKRALLVVQQLRDSLNGLTINELIKETKLSKTNIKSITKHLRRFGIIKSRKPIQLLDQRYVVYYVDDKHGKKT